MAILPLNLDYTDKDADSIRARLRNLIRGAFPDWTEEGVANFGNIMVELFAHVGDVLGFYQDNQAKESRLSDAQLRRSVLSLAKMLGYTAATARAATASELFTLAAVPANNVTIAAGTTVRTRNVTGQKVFQLLLDLTIPAGTDPPQAFGTVEDSTTINDETSSATGLPNQEVVLALTPFIDASLVVTAGNGAYTQVDDFLSSDGNDRHYTVTVDADDRATVRFGNGINGEVPSGSIVCDYKIGGGKSGNVGPGTLTIIDGAFSDIIGNPVQVSVTNPEAASDGDNRETVAQVKQNAPRSVRVSDRTVALEDYQIGAELVPGVSRALMLTSDQLPGLPENRGRLYVIPVGGGQPSEALRAAVLTAVTVTKPNTITFRVTIETPQYLTVDVRATVYFAAGVSATTVTAAIRRALEQFFQLENEDGTKNENVLFGAEYPTGRSGEQEPEIPLSDVYNAVRDVAGVRKIGDRQSDFTLNNSHTDLAINHIYFPVLGLVQITDGDTGLVVPA